MVLTKNRWQLRKAVRTINQWFENAGLQQHPDKTFIGRIEHSFDWLGYHFTKQGLTGVAESALNKMQL